MSVFPALKNETQAASAKWVEVEDVRANEARHTQKDPTRSLLWGSWQKSLTQSWTQGLLSAHCVCTGKYAAPC